MTDAPDIEGLVYIRPLGSGGYADVYLYQQQLPNRAVAVKVLKETKLTDSLRVQFTAEANAMAGLADHPNIVPVFAADVAGDGRPYLVMMFYPRPNLAVRAGTERLAVAEVLRLGVQVASAVETAHRAGILHRDIKPANVLTSQYGAPGLTDFGIAAQTALVDEDDDTGVSVPWSPPEVLYATSPASVRSDVYSLAATLWNLLVGRSPFEQANGDNSAFALMARIRDIPPPPTGRGDVPPALDWLLQQAMAKDPATRPASAMEFARSLQAIEQGMQIPRTEIVVLVESDATAPGEGPTNPGPDADPGADPTRQRGVTRVAGQTPPPPNVAPSPPGNFWQKTTAGEANLPKVGPGAGAGAVPAAGERFQGEVQPTVRRPATIASQTPAFDAPAEPETDETERPPRNKAPYLIGGAAVVVGLAVFAGIALSSGGDKHPTPVATVSASGGLQNPGVPGPDVPPGPVTISARRLSDGQISFGWTYSAKLSSDSYLWRKAGTTQQHAVTTPSVAVADPKGTRLCLQVKVVRADGSNGSTDWSTEGCSS